MHPPTPWDETYPRPVVAREFYAFQEERPHVFLVWIRSDGGPQAMKELKKDLGCGICTFQDVPSATFVVEVKSK